MLPLMLACSLPTHRESLEIIALLENGQVFEARFTKGDTGLFKGQGHLRINKWLHRNSNMAFHIDTPPVVSEISSSGADLWGHRLYRSTENDTPFWQLHVRSEEYNVSAQLQTQNTQPRIMEHNDWTVNVVSPHAKIIGWMSAAGRSSMLKGDAVLFHRYGDDLLTSDRHLLLAFDSNNHFGLEDSNMLSQSWGQVDGKLYHAQSINISPQDNHLKIHIQEDEIIFFPEKKLGEDDLFDHLSSPERHSSSMFFSLDNRHVFQGYISINATRQLPAVYIYHGATPISHTKD